MSAICMPETLKTYVGERVIFGRRNEFPFTIQLKIWLSDFSEFCHRNFYLGRVPSAAIHRRFRTNFGSILIRLTTLHHKQTEIFEIHSVSVEFGCYVITSYIIASYPCISTQSRYEFPR